MIPPLKAITGKTMMSNPIALNPQMAYRNTQNMAFRGEKLNINCNGERSLARNGQVHKLDVMA